jgi:putative oxidoreductase
MLITDHNDSMRPGVLTRSALQKWAVLPLRLIVGYGFIAHGYAKFARGPDVFAATLQGLGVPAPHVMSWTTILIEILGGLAVFVGVFVPLVSVPLAAVLIVAAWTVHLPNGFSSIKLQAVTSDGPQFGKPGYELNLLYLAGLATLVLTEYFEARRTFTMTRSDAQASRSTRLVRWRSHNPRRMRCSG